MAHFRTCLVRTLQLLILLSPIPSALGANPNYHLVGWLNTFVPGSGQVLLGQPWAGLGQAAGETASFGLGYSMSKRDPMTLDGVPEDLPVAQSGIALSSKTTRVCVRNDPRTHKCLLFQNRTSTTSSTVSDRTELNETQAGFAMTLQEFGIKYHMVNVYNAYREAAKRNGATAVGQQKVDLTSTGDLFSAPFKSKNLLNPWVGIPLLLVTGATIYDYCSQLKSGSLTPLQPLTPWSNALIGFNFVVWEPIGSGAPEEMFYRGFLQHEFYSWVHSPFFSIPMSAAMFSLSHGSSGRVGAGIAGTYLGFLAHHHDGQLSPGIAMHFWSVVVLGLETVALTLRSQGIVPPVGAKVGFAL